MTADRRKVLTVIDSLELGGAERVAVDLSNSLDPERYEVHLCATRRSGPLRDHLRDDIPVTVLGRTATWDLRKLAFFARLVRRRGIDIVHSHGRGTMKFVSLSRELRLISTPHVFHDHFGRLHKNRRAEVTVDRTAPLSVRIPLRFGVDAYLGVDLDLCQWAVDLAGVPPERVHLVRSGIDLSRFSGVTPTDVRSEFGLQGAELVLAMIANFKTVKDHLTLLRGIARCAGRERVGLVVCGSTETDPEFHRLCLDCVDELGLREQVRFVGTRDDAPSILAGADAGVLTSISESGPLAVLEYMASSLPFLVTDTGEIARAVRDCGGGLVVPVGDAGAVAAGIDELLALGPDERAARGRVGRRTVEEQFDERAATARVADIYDALLDPAGPGTRTRASARGHRTSAE